MGVEPRGVLRVVLFVVVEGKWEFVNDPVNGDAEQKVLCLFIAHEPHRTFDFCVGVDLAFVQDRFLGFVCVDSASVPEYRLRSAHKAQRGDLAGWAKISENGLKP